MGIQLHPLGLLFWTFQMDREPHLIPTMGVQTSILLKAKGLCLIVMGWSG